MTCRELISFLHRYLENELSPEARARFDDHLAICPSCVAYISNYEHTIKLAKSAFADPDGPIPDDVPEELVAAILSSKKATDS